MRFNILKRNSTKSERKFYEILKELSVRFKHRWLIEGLEIDFLIDKYAIDIDGHEQDGERNHKIASLGYIPIHLTNKDINDKEKIKRIIKQIND